jgi:DNA-binding CsgD family transcriptional regulator
MEDLKQIEALVSEGWSNREIAERLGKSEAGIRNLRYRRRLTRKTEDDIKALLQKRYSLVSLISGLEARRKELELSVENLERKKERVEQFLQLDKSQLQWVLAEALKMLKWKRPELFILSSPEQLGMILRLFFERVT